MWITHYFIALVVLAGLAAAYFWLAVSWSYSSGERAGCDSVAMIQRGNTRHH